MSKAILGAAIVEAGAITGAKPATMTDSVLAAIVAELKASREFGLPGFGTFRVFSSAQRNGANPRTGAKLVIAPSHTVRFKPSAALREEIAMHFAKAAKPAKPAKDAKTAAAPKPAAKAAAKLPTPAPAPAAKPDKAAKAEKAAKAAPTPVATTKRRGRQAADNGAHPPA